ncbi:hypothetical protein N329_06333, partial [Haliaeetus albicilla]
VDRVEEALGEEEVPMEADRDYAVSKPDILSRIERNEELCIRDGQESRQTSVRDGQESRQTSVRDGQESPQTPKEMDQKEGALGEDKVPAEVDTELPILVMNVMSLSAQKGQQHREDQPETEMEEDPAESNTEEGSLTENERACEGTSLENIKIKEEEPEA